MLRLITLICLPQILFGQITGIITDSAGDPLPFNQIQLLSADSSFSKIDLTDLDGHYSIVTPRDGRYFLTTYKFGASIQIDTITVIDSIEYNITISTDAVDLETLTVTAEKKIIEQKVDRLVFNLDKSMAATGVDMVEALSVTPMVRIDDFGIGLTGKSGVGVLIDGRPLNLTGPELINYLRSLRSDAISRIEVITTPPARYEAQGNSGLINLVLKRNPDLGWSGSVSATYAQGTFDSYSGSLLLNNQSEKISLSLSTRSTYRQNFASEDINILGENSILSRTRRKDTYRPKGGKFKAVYKASKRLTIGVDLDGTITNTARNIRDETDYASGSLIDSTLNTNTLQNNNISSYVGSLYGTLNLGRQGHQVELLINHLNNSPDSNVDFQTASSDNIRIDDITNTSRIDYSISSGQIDYSNTAKNGLTITAGSKITNFTNNSDVRYLERIGNDILLNEIRSNVFDYDEANAAAYISVNHKITNKITGKVGLRYEYSLIKGSSPGDNDSNFISYDYANLFPSAYLSYAHNKNNRWTISYSRRINRPSFSALNPFRWYSNPITYSTGNPLLLPEINNNFELSWNYRGRLNLSLYSQLLDDGFGRVVRLMGTTKVIDYTNYLSQQTYGVNGNYFVSIKSWWDTYFSVSANFSTAQSSISLVRPDNGNYLYYAINNTVSLSKKSKTKFLVNFWHTLPSQEGNLFSDHIYSLNIGFRVPISNSWTLNLMAADILKGTVSRGELFFAEYTQQAENYYDNRRVNLNVFYRFGNTRVRGVRKRIGFEDKSRAN